MGGKHGKHGKVKMSKGGVNSKLSQAVRDNYYRAEFKTLGDVLNDGRLNEMEFTRLMTLLGLPNAQAHCKVIWNEQKRVNPGHMMADEYIAMMANPEIETKTKMWRDLFREFDTDGSGYASKDDVIKGLQNMGIEVTPELRARITSMDADKDDRICYADFLKMQMLKK